ncbi:hypothetical protein [Streptomyces omiyaensis]|uniref:hypothetical protein n=1 Tax=Streptomyces omiyaensis TaxID=68247 RepID=UPI0036FC4F18
MNPLTPCDCHRCLPPTPTAKPPTGDLEHVQLPSSPRLFRVHYPDGRTQDATLHPDGRLSTDIAGQTHWSALTLDDMRRANWAPPTRIEWDPPPLTLPTPRPPTTLPAAPATFDDEDHPS